MELSAAVIFYLLFDLLLTSVSSVKVHYLYWNSSNPIFRIDNTDHIVDVNQGNSPFEFDQLNIICPSGQGGVPGGRGSRGTGEDERYLVYNVSKEEYDTCRINQQNPKVVAQCQPRQTSGHHHIQVIQSQPAGSGVPPWPGLLLHLYQLQVGPPQEGRRLLLHPQHEGDLQGGGHVRQEAGPGHQHCQAASTEAGAVRGEVTVRQTHRRRQTVPHWDG